MCVHVCVCVLFMHVQWRLTDANLVEKMTMAKTMIKEGGIETEKMARVSASKILKPHLYIITLRLVRVWTYMLMEEATILGGGGGGGDGGATIS